MVPIIQVLHIHDKQHPSGADSYQEQIHNLDGFMWDYRREEARK